jgi:serine O-acetyltransferase
MNDTRNSKQHELDDLTVALLQSYEREGGINHLDGTALPTRGAIITMVRDILALLFPGFYQDEGLNSSNLRHVTALRLSALHDTLLKEFYRNLMFEYRGAGKEERAQRMAVDIAQDFLRQMPALRSILSTDVDALLQGDPAARSREEIILVYPGLRAIAVHRIAHFLWTHGLHLIARMMNAYIHSRTGIDIHPGASIGKYFHIDHGTGVVIGETAIIGEHVKLYQGVTLGALSVRKDMAKSRRHPTIEDRVTIYAAATILGGQTVIGHDSVIGGNVWLVQSVAPRSLVLSEPRINVRSPENAAPWYYEI